jgi:hypothetical protein
LGLGDELNQSAGGSDDTLIEQCRKTVVLKYRIDDFLGGVFRRLKNSEAVTHIGFDWLTTIGRDLNLDDEEWISSRAPGFHDIQAGSKEWYRYSLSPFAFAMAIFPFVRTVSYPGDDVLASGYIDSSLTIGSTFHERWPDSPLATIPPFRRLAILDASGRR